MLRALLLIKEDCIEWFRQSRTVPCQVALNTLVIAAFSPLVGVQGQQLCAACGSCYGTSHTNLVGSAEGTPDITIGRSCLPRIYRELL
jgi:hypothetical protein